MIRNKFNSFSFDRGINRKKNGKLLQQCAACTRIDAVFRPFIDSFLNKIF